MAKAKRVKLYNKGTRNWTLKDNGKDVTCAPGRCIDLNEAQANKIMESYPHDFIYSGDVPMKGTKEVKKLKTEVEKLAADNKLLGNRIVELEETDAGKKIKALEEENAELKVQMEGLAKALEEKTTENLQGD